MREFLIGLMVLVPIGVAAQDAVPSLVPDTVRPRAASVQSSTLQDVGPWGAAALPDGLAPLSSDLWRGADPETLNLLLEKISPDQRFPSLQALIRQAVFSGGSAPTNDPEVIRRRFEAANRLGPAEASARLVFGVPRLASDVGLAAIAIDAGLRVGRTDEACSLIEAVSAPASGTSWLEARAACYALNGEAGAANLSVDLAKSRGLTDTWMSRAIAAVAGPLTAPPPFRVDSGRAIALSLRAKLKPPVTLAALQDPMASSALVGIDDFMASLPPEERVTLARNGASRGVVSAAVMAKYQPAPDAATAFLPLPAQITGRLLGAPNIALRALEGRNALNELKGIMNTQPGLMTLSDAPILTEAALWAGDGALASAIAALSPNALDPRLALVKALYDPDGQTTSIQQRIEAANADPVVRRIAMRDGVIAWAAGLPSGRGLSTLANTGLPWAQAGNFGLRAALEIAAGNGSKGEVILLTAFALQGVDPAAVDAETLISGIRALRRVGLPDAARDLARDYLLATYVTLPARPAPRPRVGATPRPAAPIAAPAIRATPSPPPSAAPLARATPSPAPSRLAPPPAQRVQPAQRAPTSTKPSWGTP